MKKIEEIKAIIEKYIQDTFTEEQLIESFNTASINEILEKSLQYFSKFLKQLNFQVKYYDIKDESEFNNYILDIFSEFWTYGFALDTLQDRVFILKNYRGLGSISIEKQGVIASFTKKYPLKFVDGDFCWGYKNGGSVVRTARVLLNEVIYDYDQLNEIHHNMASDFANEVLSIFQQNKPARIEERKIIDWLTKYRENNNISTNENIVKKVCLERGITQKELSDELDVPTPTMSRWAKGDIPKMANIALNLMIENKNLKEKFEILKKAHKILSEE